MSSGGSQGGDGDSGETSVGGTGGAQGGTGGAQGGTGGDVTGAGTAGDGASAGMGGSTVGGAGGVGGAAGSNGGTVSGDAGLGGSGSGGTPITGGSSSVGGSFGAGGSFSAGGTLGSSGNGGSGPVGGSAGFGNSSGAGTGGASGGSGNAGSGGSGNAGSGGGPTCPATSRGATMVPVPVDNGASYCIDRTEVTNAEYQAFLSSPDAGASEVIPSNPCSWNTSYVPTASWPPQSGEGNLPVVFVDWCDAKAYCAWAGKRLCGKVGGGAIAFDPPDSNESQWYRACSRNDARKFPYGDEYEPATCNGDDHGVGQRVAAGSMSCEGGYSNLEDMSGNVMEWDDSCGSTNGATDLCRVRGGSFEHDQSHLICGNGDSAHRQDKLYHVGIRCCADTSISTPD